MKSYLVLMFSIFLILSCTFKTAKSKDSNAATVLPPVSNPYNYDKVGFKCDAGGKSSELVSKFSKLIRNKDYYQQKKGLYCSVPGICYLATFSCERLAEEGMIDLNRTEIQQMQKNRTKTDTIYTCSGCTGSENFTVQQILPDTSNHMRMEAGWWMDEVLGKNIILKKEEK